MNNKLLILFLISLGVLMRVLPHQPNFTPVAAIALFSGTYLPRRYALLIPLIIMFLSDLFLGFHPTMVWVYGSLLLSGILGSHLRDSVTFSKVVGLSLLSSVVFFLLTNFGVWISTSMYPKNPLGLLDCYVMAIPFFRNTLLGDLIYCGLLYTSTSFSNSFSSTLSYRNFDR